MFSVNYKSKNNALLLRGSLLRENLVGVALVKKSKDKNQRLTLSVIEDEAWNNELLSCA